MSYPYTYTSPFDVVFPIGYDDKSIVSIVRKTPSEVADEGSLILHEGDVVTFAEPVEHVSLEPVEALAATDAATKAALDAAAKVAPASGITVIPSEASTTPPAASAAPAATPAAPAADPAKG
jgi:hypothetical protein